MLFWQKKCNYGLQNCFLSYVLVFLMNAFYLLACTFGNRCGKSQKKLLVHWLIAMLFVGTEFQSYFKV